jgi:YVTN family beta-propeller protein
MKTVPSYAVTAEIALGVMPECLAVSQRGDHIYVTSFVDEEAVTVIRTADNAVSRIPLTFRPEGVVVGPDGRRLYVADPAGRRVAVIDTVESTTAFVGVGDRPLHMAFLGTDLYVANNQDGTVSVIDTVDTTVVRTIEVGGHPYAVAAARRRVFVTDYGFYGGQSTHRVSVIGAARGQVIDTIPVGYYPTGIAVAPDGSRVYVTNDEGSYTRTHPGHHNGHRHHHRQGHRHPGRRRLCGCGHRRRRSGLRRQQHLRNDVHQQALDRRPPHRPDRRRSDPRDTECIGCQWESDLCRRYLAFIGSADHRARHRSRRHRRRQRPAEADRHQGWF